jgi:hypothetical protein
MQSCTLTNWLKGTEHITPYFNSYIMQFARPGAACGANANLAGSPNPKPNALTDFILRIPGG